ARARRTLRIRADGLQPRLRIPAENRAPPMETVPGFRRLAADDRGGRGPRQAERRKLAADHPTRRRDRMVRRLRAEPRWRPDRHAEDEPHREVRPGRPNGHRRSGRDLERPRGFRRVERLRPSDRPRERDREHGGRRDQLRKHRLRRSPRREPAGRDRPAPSGPAGREPAQDRLGGGRASKENGVKLVPALTDQLWRDRYNNYSARRLSRGLVTSYNLIPVSRLPEAVDRAVDIRDKLKLNGAVQAFLVDSTSAALVPYVLMDDTRPSGGTALGFVKRMGDAAFKMDGHSMGLGLFLVFNLRKMHGRATSFISSVKVVFDRRMKIN